jgi:hypothetical protein
MAPEFTFELQVCRWAEQHWPPGGVAAEHPVIVARQFGTRRRRWDTIVVEVDPEGLAVRAQFGERALDSDLLHVVRNAPADWAWYRDALPEPDYPWRYVREAVTRAAEWDLVERRRTGNKVELRRQRPYPDWVERVVAIENKPDLDASAADSLRTQLEHDVALGLADEVWVATRATGERVEPALLERLPVEAGVLVLDETGAGLDGTAAWHPAALDADAAGTRIEARPTGNAHDASAAEVSFLRPAEKREKRLEIAERAYARGWRSYADSVRSDCRHFELKRRGDALVPWCAAKACHQTPTTCRSGCADFAPEPPAWRTNGWPISGGPGKGIERLLERRRERARPE